MSMKVLVTGGAGFIGSNVADALIERNYDVTILDNLSTGKRENINKKAIFIEKDIRDKSIKEIFDKEKINVVFHFAAQMDVRKSIEDPFFDADVNITGTLNLLENCMKYGVKKFIFASSGGVMYGECRESEIKPKESKYPNPLCPYGISKLAAEFYLNFYRASYGLQSAALRFGNVYGPRQDPHGEAGVVAIFTKAMLSGISTPGGNEVKIFGGGEQLRDYVYISDVVKANLLAMEKGAGVYNKNNKIKQSVSNTEALAEGVYNIATGESKSVNELFKVLSKIISYTGSPHYQPPREGEVDISRLDVSKAERDLKWRADVDFKSGLEKTVEYFKNN